MPKERRSFQRQPEETRRESLIQAALDLMAEGGPRAATVRAIAEHAGITPGLIRHYFTSKEELTRAAYLSLMERMTKESQTAAEAADTPVRALASVISTSLRPPVMDGTRIRLWAGFLHMVHNDPDMREVHEATYLAYRNLLQSLIEKLPGKSDPATAHALAIACNAVIDGLWLEGGALPASFAEGEIERIGKSAIAAILGIDPAEFNETSQQGPTP
ncbi:TetR/AcrR family transcriptional regulator [Thioclava sp. FR2]|uniref:TetR/AcrR family transcriptional regulator n=1 Tax=Thioclava sp. FR2 TaxID=3445780 RepID=UPI003EBEE635